MRQKLIIITCKSLWKGNASIGTHILEAFKSKGETFAIRHKKDLMTIDPIEHYKFFQLGKNPKKFPHTDGRSGFYTLKYINWIADEKETDNVI